MTTEIQHAPAPKRANVAFTINLGMIPVRMRLFSPTEDETGTQRHQYVEVEVKDDKDNVTVESHPVGNRNYDKETGLNVEFGDIIKKVEVPNPYPRPGEADVLIELTDEEIVRVTAGNAVDRGDVPIEAFIPLDTLGTRYHVSKWYQVRPALRQEKRKSVPDPQANKAFVLLMAAMEAKGVAALLRLGIKSAARFAALTPDGRLHMLHFDSEVREDYPWPDETVDQKHIDGAAKLIEGYGIETPALVDENSILLTAYLTQKAKDGTVIDALPEPVETEDEPDLDFAVLLEASAAVVKSAKKKAKVTA